MHRCLTTTQSDLDLHRQNSKVICVQCLRKSTLKGCLCTVPQPLQTSNSRKTDRTNEGENEGEEEMTVSASNNIKNPEGPIRIFFSDGMTLREQGREPGQKEIFSRQNRGFLTDQVKVLEIDLIRHGMTAGNKEQRYIGSRTDEPLCEEGRASLNETLFPRRELLFVSPMKRCLETAELLFSGQETIVIPELTECDFGRFENKNYLELSGDPDYQAFIDSNGTTPFPEGESREDFRKRSLAGFQKAVELCIAENAQSAAIVAHGGTIMNILEALAEPRRSFYEWHLKNGEAWHVQVYTEKPAAGSYIR